MSRRISLKEHNRLMAEAIDRYLQLCGEGTERGICDDGSHDDDCPLADRPCVKKSGGLCHWCQLDAARCGEDWKKYDQTRMAETPSR